MLKGILRQWKIWNLMHKEHLIAEEMLELHQAADYIEQRKQSLWLQKAEVRQQLAEVSKS